MDDIENSVRQACILGHLSQQHTGSRILLTWFHDKCVPTTVARGNIWRGRAREELAGVWGGGWGNLTQRGIMAWKIKGHTPAHTPSGSRYMYVSMSLVTEERVSHKPAWTACSDLYFVYIQEHIHNYVISYHFTFTSVFI